jgi:phospholipid/cholesterol/gamma-HCH transport system substrate-binding protein
MEIQVGIFVVAGTFLVMLMIILLGGATSVFSPQHKYLVYFKEVSGLIPGAKVVLNGIRVGVVSDIDLDEKTQNIRIDLEVNSKYGKWIRADSRAVIATQGVLGDKFILLQAGSADQAEVPAGGEIPTGVTSDLSGFISSGEALIHTLQSTASTLDSILKNFDKKNRSDRFFENLTLTATNAAEVTNKLKVTTDTLNSILKKIDRGQGSVGALINDPELYNDAKALVGGISRNRVMRNLIRKTIRDREAEDADTAAPEPQKK